MSLLAAGQFDIQVSGSFTQSSTSADDGARFNTVSGFQTFDAGDDTSTNIVFDKTINFLQPQCAWQTGDNGPASNSGPSGGGSLFFTCDFSIKETGSPKQYCCEVTYSVFIEDPYFDVEARITNPNNVPNFGPTLDDGNLYSVVADALTFEFEGFGSQSSAMGILFQIKQGLNYTAADVAVSYILKKIPSAP